MAGISNTPDLPAKFGARRSIKGGGVSMQTQTFLKE